MTKYRTEDLKKPDKLEEAIKAAMRRNPSTAMFMKFYDQLESETKERTEWLQDIARLNNK